MPCILYSDDPLHYSTFKLRGGSRPLPEKYQPPSTTLLRVLMSCFQYLVCARFFFVLPLLLRVPEVNFGLSPVTGGQAS